MKVAIQLLLIVLLSGCVTVGKERARARDIQIGMSEEQVVQIMGRPFRVSNWGDETRYSWQDIVVVFEDGRAVSNISSGQDASVTIRAEAFLGSVPKKRIAMILPSVKGMTKDDLEFISVRNLVSNILNKNGYEVLDEEKKVDTVVFVNFGISEPKTKTETWTEPVYDYVTPQSSSTTHNVFNQLGQQVGQVQSHTTSGSNDFIPDRVYRGERTRSKTTTTYVRHLIMEAADYTHFKKINKVKPLWKVVTISEGVSDDLRNVLPLLGVVAKQMVEFDTQGKITGNVYVTDQRARDLVGSRALAPDEH